MTKSTKKASSRIFYTAPRNWKVFRWIFTPAGLVVMILSAWFTIAITYIYW